MTAWLRHQLLAASVALPASAPAKDIRVGFTLDTLNLDPVNHLKRETETILP